MKGLLASLLIAATFPFTTLAAPIVIGYQTGVDPSKVAQADGVFEKTIGQPLDWRRFNSGPEVVAALASGSIQIGNLGSSPFAAATSRNLPIVAFLVSTQIHGAEALVVRNASHINSYQDLKGKTLATPFVSTSHYSLLAALKHWGYKPDDVKIVNLNPPEIAAAWKRGDIDGAFVWSPALSQIEKDGKVLTDAKQVGEWGNPTFEVWVTRKDFAEQHPEVLAKYAHVVLESFDQYAQHPEQYRATSENAQKIAKLVGVSAQDIPGLLSGSVYPTYTQQLSASFLEGGSAIATKATAEFLVEQHRIPAVLPDYRPFISDKFVKLSRQP